MLLVIDIGNTNIVYGLFDGDTLLHQFRVESSRSKTSDEYAVALLQLLAYNRVDTARVSAAIIASVVPSLTTPMIQVVKRTFGIEPMVVGPGLRTGMAILYENPHEVGADRIVNAVAAYERVKASVIVVDFGTATTFDCVNPKGEYLGGVIAPGVQISADALFARAARLPRVEISKPAKVVGRTTTHSIQSGLVYGYVGLVDGLVDRLRDEMGGRSAVIATGGLATMIAPLSRTIEIVDDVLTLTGLRLIYGRNA